MGHILSQTIIMSRSLYLNIVAFLALTLALSVSMQAGGPGPRPAHLFHSYSGDVSDIRLRMNEDHTFSLEMYLVAFNDFVLMKGTWADKGDRFELTFTQNRPTIENLFEEDMIVDEHTFQIVKEYDEFFIYGTLCVKNAGSPSLAQNK